MQETADKSNRLKNSLPEDNLVKQENIKIHGIGLDKAGRCTHYSCIALCEMQEILRMLFLPR